MVKIVTIIALFFINNATVAAVSIDVKVDKTQISNLDNLNLFISNIPFNKHLNTNALNQDFKIVGRSKSTSFSSINGKNTKTSRLQLTLQPKRIGTLTIPVFKLGKATSKPIKIQVSRANETDFEKNIIFIKTKVSHPKPRVQEQLIYTVSLYVRSNIRDANLDFRPRIDANVKKLKESKILRSDFKGQKLWKKDFNFAIYPQKTGNLEIPSIKQQVRVNNTNVLLFSNPIKLTVLPTDKTYPVGEYWLPAKNLELSAKPFKKGQKFFVGEPIVRQIIIKVNGQSATQVPDIMLTKTKAFEQYPDNRSSKEKLSENNVISTVEQNILLIANQSGEQTLPAINLPWFDTHENKTKVARIPEIKIMVGAPLNTPKTLILPILKDEPQTKPKPVVSKINWKLIAIISLILWVLTLLIFYLHYRSKPKKQPKNTKTPNINELKMIKKYAKENNPAQTKAALDRWVFAEYGLLDVGAFANQLGADFDNEVFILQQNLYRSKGQWDGRKFYQIFESALKNKTISKDKSNLPTLYPDNF